MFGNGNRNRDEVGVGRALGVRDWKRFGAGGWGRAWERVGVEVGDRLGRRVRQ